MKKLGKYRGRGKRKERKEQNLSIKIKELPEEERPYEKLELYGAKRLSNAELLAIIIKTGTKEDTSVQLAQKILNLNSSKQNLTFLNDLEIEDFMKIKGIGRVKAIQLKAVCELTNRMSKPLNYKEITINRPEDVANMLMQELKHEKQEIMKTVLLNSKNKIIKIVDVVVGSVNSVYADIKEVLSEAIKINAPKMILVHNHPSGDVLPSQKDIEFTGKLMDVSEALGIELMDHIVIGNMTYTSIFEKAVEYKGRTQNNVV